MIYVNELHKYFGDLEVLKGINCHIQKGECVCVIGASGSGKSTFLRCLNLLEQPTKGDITIGDQKFYRSKAECGRASQRCWNGISAFQICSASEHSG